jgi:hypothetical protein
MTTRHLVDPAPESFLEAPPLAIQFQEDCARALNKAFGR